MKSELRNENLELYYSCQRETETRFTFERWGEREGRKIKVCEFEALFLFISPTKLILVPVFEFLVCRFFKKIM